MTFDLTGSDVSGDIQTGKPLELSIAIGGVAQVMRRWRRFVNPCCLNDTWSTWSLIRSRWS